MENPASGEKLSSSESNHGKVDDETTKIFIGEPAPPPVVSPHDKIQSLPRFMNLNQPAVMSTTQLMEVKSSNIVTNDVTVASNTHQSLVRSSGEVHG
jgi:hypothetical protein